MRNATSRRAPFGPPSAVLTVLEQMAKDRFNSLGRSLLDKEVNTEEKELKPCYALEDGELCCHFADEVAELPSLEGDDFWVLSDAYLPSPMPVVTGLDF